MTDNTPAASRRRLHNLVAWRKAMDLAVKVHQLAVTFPGYGTDPFGGDLVAAAVRVPTLIAIGHESDEPITFVEQLTWTCSALVRTEVLVMLAERLGLVSRTASAPILARITQLGRIVHGLRRAVEKRRNEAMLAEVREEFGDADGADLVDSLGLDFAHDMLEDDLAAELGREEDLERGADEDEARAAGEEADAAPPSRRRRRRYPRRRPPTNEN